MASLPGHLWEVETHQETRGDQRSTRGKGVGYIAVARTLKQELTSALKELVRKVSEIRERSWG